MYNKIICFALLTLAFSSCTKWTEVPPLPHQVPVEHVFATDESAQSAIAGIYSNMMSSDLGISNGGITLFAGLSADEFMNQSFDVQQQEFYDNNLTADNLFINQLWTNGYAIIYQANAAYEGLVHSTGLSGAVSSALKGEALFIRAFIHCSLAALFGDIPYVDTTDYNINTDVQRMSIQSVYERIITDLLLAKELLPEANTSPQRTRPTRQAASALLSRVYLYTEQWHEAIDESSLLINATNLYQLNENVESVFLPFNAETIWQLVPVLPMRNTNEGYYFISEGFPGYISLNEQLVDTFDPADKRNNWIDSVEVDGTRYYFPAKYKVGHSEVLSEYYVVFRLAEQFLIRAEARANSGLLTDAADDLNTIRTRAGLAPVSLTSAEEFAAALMDERRLELFAEWGHRWADLKRKNIADAVLGPLKPGWNANDILYPIPRIQLQNNAAFGQNPGY